MLAIFAVILAVAVANPTPQLVGLPNPFFNQGKNILSYAELDRIHWLW